MPNVKVERKTNTISIVELVFGGWFIYDNDIYIKLHTDSRGITNAYEINTRLEISFSSDTKIEPIADKNISIKINIE